MKKLSLLLLSAMFATGVFAQEGKYVPSEENLKARSEFQDRKFGVFLHWGLYSMMGTTEWMLNAPDMKHEEYKKLAGAFYPGNFDAEKWVKTIKDAGAKYITITTRHHDGFSLFDTKYSDYDVMDATPFKRDIIKELAAACDKYGIKLHLYYSHLDWGRNDYPLGRTGRGTGRPTDQQNWGTYYKFMNNQLTELLTNYGSVGAIWFDGWWDHDEDKTPFNWELPQQYAMIHKLQPSCLIGNNHHQTPFEGEDIQIFERDLPGENTAGLSGQSIGKLPLESCQTINDHWGFSMRDHNYKSNEELIQMLVRAAGKNANLLLNVGPQPDGNLPERAVTRLAAMGKWLEKNGETIYGTRGGIVGPHDWGVSTQKGNKLYIHVLSLNDKGLFLPTGDTKFKKAYEFATGKPVKFAKSKEGVTLFFDKAPTGVDYIVALEMK